jgi:general L-amino acid transport system ATP-binding protein
MMIRITGLNKWYGAYHALCDVDLEVGAGERIVVWGPSGSGKSTLVQCVAGLEPFQAGSIVVDGASLKANAADNHAAARGVGMVFQNFHLFPHLRVIDNLTIGPMLARHMPRREATDMAMSYLGKVRLADQREKYPAHLSGGQQQRVAIARALCMQPRIMLFDEPTSSLDPELKREVWEVMFDLAEEGMTMMVVTHERQMARRFARRVVLVDEGRVVGECPPDRIPGPQ